MRIEKQQAIRLRKTGLSYNEIVKKLDIPKSTLSGWFRGLDFSQRTTNQNIKSSKKIWAASITAYNKQRSRDAIARQEVIAMGAMQEIQRFTVQDLLLVGTALYWVEGYKRSRWNIVFSNTDERMIKLVMRYFLEVCQVPLSKIRGQVQVHSQHQVKNANQYWSGISGIPIKQFRKELYQIPISSKRKIHRRLINGTFRIIINDVATVSRIQGWIQGIGNQT